MKAGVSTACMYPTVLEKAFHTLAKNGIKTVELFVNSDCELSEPYLSEMLAIQKEYSVDVVSVHPFTCGIEPMMFFTAYERRVDDMLEYYKKFFEYMNKFNAKYFIFHGNKNQNVCEDELYFERYLKIQETADNFDVCVAQENVSRCTGGSLDFLVKMKNALGDKVSFVLDVKQTHRSGYDPILMVETLGKNIRHVHFSDSGKNGDCLKFGFGEYDNDAFFKALQSFGYDGNVMLELYRNGYDDEIELSENYFELQNYFIDNGLI